MDRVGPGGENILMRLDGAGDGAIRHLAAEGKTAHRLAVGESKSYSASPVLDAQC
jgi:hypothetical protein